MLTRWPGGRNGTLAEPRRSVADVAFAMLQCGPISAQSVDAAPGGVATCGKTRGVPRQADFMWVRNNQGNVFVGNLPPDFPDERLAETFDPYGIVLSAIVARDPETGARLRYGFVDIATERAANQAISALDGSEIDGCKLKVKPREKAAARKPGAAAMRRPPMRAARPSASPPREFAEAPPPRRQIPMPAATPRPPAQSEVAERRVSQTERAMEALPEIEPPPRRDFEVVRRPIRRTTTPTFQVERRSLPRRV
jgi:RNA recognition motif-containing protein